MDYGHYTNMAANATVVCMPHQGGLHRVIVNYRGTGGNLLTLYDSAISPPPANAPVLAVIDVVNAPIGELAYGVQVQNGVVAVLGTGVAGNVTVVTD